MNDISNALLKLQLLDKKRTHYKIQETFLSEGTHYDQENKKMNTYIQEALDTLKTLTEDAWIDNETGEEFQDYHTGEIKNPPSDIFDTTTTGVPFYDDLLPSSPETTRKILQKNKNLKGEIVYLSPREYYNICANDIFNEDPEDLEKSRDMDTQIDNHLNKLIFKYKKQLPLTFINYATVGQEGLHRMLVLAKNFGWDVKYPVLIVDWYDKELAKIMQDENKSFIYERIKSICDDILEHTYSSVDELIKNIEPQIINTEHSIIKNNDGSVTVTVYGVSYKINPEDIILEKPIEDIKADNIEDIDALLNDISEVEPGEIFDK